MKIYVAGGVYKDINVIVMGENITVPFSSLGNGIIGVLYVYEDEQKALASGEQVLELEATVNKKIEEL